MYQVSCASFYNTNNMVRQADAMASTLQSIDRLWNIDVVYAKSALHGSICKEYFCHPYLNKRTNPTH